MTLQTIPGRAIELGSDAEGDLAYYDGSKWTRLAAGTAGEFLATNSGATAPEWVATATSVTYHGGVTLVNGVTDHTFSSIPAGVTRMRLIIYELSASGTDNLLIQFGDSGGIETTGYTSSSGRIDGSTPTETGSTSGFIIRLAESAGDFCGMYDFHRMSSGTTYWAGSHSGCQASTLSNTSGGGSKIMYGGPITDLKIGWTGSDTFTVAGTPGLFVSKMDLLYWQD
jgi:hypothetical protein